MAAPAAAADAIAATLAILAVLDGPVTVLLIWVMVLVTLVSW
jgi:hypothetical protein